MGFKEDAKTAYDAWQNMMRLLWVEFRRFQFNINIGDILLLLMLGTALHNLWIFDDQYPYFFRNPAVIEAQRCEQLLGAKIEGIADPGCRVTMACPTHNYTQPIPLNSILPSG